MFKEVCRNVYRCHMSPLMSSHCITFVSQFDVMLVIAQTLREQRSIYTLEGRGPLVIFIRKCSFFLD